MTTILTHTACLEHVTPEGHPERVARLEHALAALQQLELTYESAPLAEHKVICSVHPQSYVDELQRRLPQEGFWKLDADTFLSPRSMEAAMRAAGAVIRAVDLVLTGECTNAFCAVRPPGHHAEKMTAMGFCLLGNAAIGAMYALRHHGLERVAVVDFDVHHGNGTQDLLWNEAGALTITSQQMPLWPGTGNPSERGAHDNVMNLALSPGSGGAEMRAAYSERVFPRLRRFKPELIIISAGFDAHQDDPLANLNWTTDDFRWLTRELCSIAAELCEGRVVSTLEGGYDLEALAASTRAHVEELLEASL